MQNEKTLNIREDFFEQTFVKKLRALENGGEYILIYLKLQSLSAGKNGKISCEKTNSNLAQELASKIDEEAKDIELALSLFEKHNLIKFSNSKDSFTFCSTPVIEYK